MNCNPPFPLRRIVGRLMLAATVFLLGTGAARSATDADRAGASDPPREPAAVVQRLHEALLEAARIGQGDGATGGFDARRDRLDPIVTETFDIALIARLSLAAHWSDLTAAQQRRFTDLLRRYTVASYAARFKRDRGQRFEPGDVQQPREDIRVVRTRFITGAGETRRFDYQLRQDDSCWRIVNVAVDGVSDLAIKRAEYSDLYQKQGFDALADRLAEQIADLGDSETDG